MTTARYVVGCQTYAPAAFTPRNIPGTPRAMVWPEGNMSLKKSCDTTGNRSRDRPTSSALTTTLPQAPPFTCTYINYEAPVFEIF